MENTTYRQYKLWHAYLEDEWNQPSRTDYYLMRIALEVARKLATHPERIQLKDFKLDFTTVPEPPPPVEPDLEPYVVQTDEVVDEAPDAQQQVGEGASARAEYIRNVSAIAKAEWIQYLGGPDKVRIVNQ